MKKIEELEKEWNNLKLPYNMDYHDQEKLKSLAWSLIFEYKKLKNFKACAFYLLHGVITSHYWRARQFLERRKNHESLLRKIRGKKYYPFYELDIDHYTCHWLDANGDRQDLFPSEVIDHIKNDFHYVAEKCKYMPKGMTTYQFSIKKN